MATRSFQGRPSGHEAGLCDIAFSTDGATVLTCGGEGQVLLWNADKVAAAGRSGEVAHDGVISDDAAGITCMATLGDGAHVITGSYDGREVKQWDMAGRSLDKCLTSCPGHVHHVAINKSGSLMCVRCGGQCVPVCCLLGRRGGSLGAYASGIALPACPDTSHLVRGHLWRALPAVR